MMGSMGERGAHLQGAEEVPQAVAVALDLGRELGEQSRVADGATRGLKVVVPDLVDRLVEVAGGLLLERGGRRLDGRERRERRRERRRRRRARRQRDERRGRRRARVAAGRERPELVRQAAQLVVLWRRRRLRAKEARAVARQAAAGRAAVGRVRPVPGLGRGPQEQVGRAVRLGRA